MFQIESSFEYRSLKKRQELRKSLASNFRSDRVVPVKTIVKRTRAIICGDAYALRSAIERLDVTHLTPNPALVESREPCSGAGRALPWSRAHEYTHVVSS